MRLDTAELSLHYEVEPKEENALIQEIVFSPRMGLSHLTCVAVYDARRVSSA